MKYILIISRYFPPKEGGTEAHTYGYTKGFIDNDRDVIVITPQYLNSKEFDAKQSFKITRFNDFNSKFIRLLLFGLLSAYYLIRYDISFIFTSGWSPGGIICYLLKKFFHIKYIVSAHGTEILRFKHRNSLRIKVFSNAQRIVAVSQYTKKKLIDMGISPDLITVLPNGVDINSFYPGEKSNTIFQKYNIEKNKTIFLTVSRLETKKGIDTVIEIFHKYQSEFNDAYYLIGGQGHDRQRLQNLILEYKLGSKIKLLGFVTQSLLLQLYQSSDIFIMVPREDSVNLDIEGFGIVYLEAGACGKPVISSNNAGVLDAVKDKVTGLMVDPTDEINIMNAMIKLKNNIHLRNTYGTNAINNINSNFLWSNIAKTLLDIINGNTQKK